MTPLEEARALLSNSHHPVFFTGAGVSADSGVPTFRSASGESFWGKYDPQLLATPEGFAADPQLVYDFYTMRRRQLLTIQPNPAHLAIARWQASKSAIVITQNVDGLHERVAPPNSTILRLHGSLAEDRCSWCFYRETLDLANLPPLRNCPHCGARMRPDIVWFGETLDPDIWSAAEQAASETDLMLVVGTSGEVFPAAGLVRLAARRAPIIVVNLDPGSHDSLATLTLHGRAADLLPQLQPQT